MEFSNRVQRIRADPQVARPYRPEQVEAIHALGHAVDERLAAGDVRLTMGGEPTFVSATDLESGQWRFEADGDRRFSPAGSRPRSWRCARTRVC